MIKGFYITEYHFSPFMLRQTQHERRNFNENKNAAHTELFEVWATYSRMCWVYRSTN